MSKALEMGQTAECFPDARLGTRSITIVEMPIKARVICCKPTILEFL